MKKFLFYFAVSAWIISLIVHSLSIFKYDVSGKIPFVWILHVAIFIVWIPTIREMKKNPSLEHPRVFSDDVIRKFYSNLFRNTPRWLTVLSFLCLAYTIINFILFISTQNGTAEISKGQYVLMDHSKLLRTITVEEYHHYKANVLRGFSGHWLTFYIIAAAVLYPYKKKAIIS